MTAAALSPAAAALSNAAAGGRADVLIAGLRKSFGATPVLRDVDVTIAQREVTALIGKNGSGKSTLLRCALRLIEPDAGRVELFGQAVTGIDRLSLRRVRAQVGFIFQRHNLVARLSALSNVIHGVQARRRGPRTWRQAFARAEDRVEAMACLETVGLAEIAMRRVDNLSGGQAQRVAIARTLMQRPRMIFADEPTASLDPRAADEVMAALSRLRGMGLTILFSTHNPGHALQHADRVIGIQNGEITMDCLSAACGMEQLRGFYD